MTIIHGDLGIDRVASNTVGPEDLTWIPPFTKEYTSPQQTITSGGTLTLSHLLGAIPKLIRTELMCITNDGSHLAGEIIELGDGYIPVSSLTSVGHEIKKTSTEIKVIYGNSATVYLAKTAAGVSEPLTNANWRLVVRAWA